MKKVTKPGRAPIPNAVRFAIFKRDGFACRYCGAKPSEAELEVDHVKPIALGGQNDPDNLVTCCVACNKGKGPEPLDENSIMDRHREASDLLAIDVGDVGEFVVDRDAAAEEAAVESKRGRGRPPHVPTAESRRIVEALAGFGIPHKQIATVVRISFVTLEKSYGPELERGAAVVESSLIGNLLRLAKGKDGTALRAIMFSLRSRFGWSEYAPGISERGLGKKEVRQIEAQRPPDDAEWGELLH